MKIVFLFITFFLFNCNKNAGNTETKSVLVKDTIVVRKLISEELAVFPDEKEYFVVIKKDTSNFSCIFSKISTNEIFLEVNHYNNRNISLTDSSAIEGKKEKYMFKDSYYKTSYKEQMRELNLILEEANKDFNLNSINSINFGTLADNGDLAIQVTKSYTQKYGMKNLDNYNFIEQILQNSQLKNDLNNILKPYFLSVDKIGIENLFFTDKSCLFHTKKIEADSTIIPDKILNGSIYIKLSKT
jgi:hypothetical protein